MIMATRDAICSPPSAPGEKAINKIVDVLLSCLLMTVHLLVVATDVVVDFTSVVWRRHRRFICSRDPFSPDMVELASLTKRPSHVAFLVASSGTVPWADLARLMRWCAVTGVQSITLYDEMGRIKRQGREKLTRELSQRDLENFCWTKKAEDCSSKVKVSLVSPSDGKGELVQAAVTMAQRVRDEELNPASVDEGLIDRWLLERRDGIPDPELLIRFGEKNSSNRGFLPWQTRLTEVHDLATPPGDFVEFKDFMKVLKAYSRCEQRLGK